MAVEIMSGVLFGAAFGSHVNNLFKNDVPPANVGHSFIVLDIVRWMPLEDYYARMDQFLEEVKAVPRAREVEEVFYPGERRYLSYLEKTKEGVALSVGVQEELDRLAVECGIVFPSPAGTA
jgi:LDH2 family malate/lactate/ureidoglycolate dehydrogenase